MDTRLTVPQLRMDRSKAELQVTRLAVRSNGQSANGSFELALNAPSLSVSPELATGEPLPVR